MIKRFSFLKHKSFIFHVFGGLFLYFLIFGISPNTVEATHILPECPFACGDAGCPSTREFCTLDGFTFCATSVFCPVELVSPADGATVNTLTPPLDWNQSGGAVAYSINLTGDTVWNKIFTTDSGTVDSGVLVNNGNYNWRVRACTLLDCLDPQPFSTLRSFRVTVAASTPIPTSTPVPTSTPPPGFTCLGCNTCNIIPGEEWKEKCVRPDFTEFCRIDVCTAPTSTPTPTTAPGLWTLSGSVLLDDGAGGGTPGNCAIDGTEKYYQFGATVTASGGIPETTTTNAAGFYSFSLPTGTYSVSVSEPGYNPSSTCPWRLVPLSSHVSAPLLAIVPAATPTPTPTPTPTGTPPTAAFTITASGIIATVTDKSTKGTNPIAKWSWDFNGDGTLDLIHISLLPPPISFTFNYSGFGPGTYSVKLTVEDTSGLKSSATNPITIVDTTPPTVSVDHDPNSPKEDCSVTVTTTADDPESGLKRVGVAVDLDKDGTPGNDAGESFFCVSSPFSPCKWELKPPIKLTAGKYKYYGSAESNNPNPDPNINSNSTTEKEFTVTATKGTLQCLEAVGCKCTKISTAIGPVDVAPAAFVSRIMSLLLGVAGGIAVLLIIAAGYSLITSRDNPQTVQDARERILAAIVGLLFVIFALVILEVIGVDILRIPGFGP